MKKNIKIFLGVFLFIIMMLTLKSNAGYTSNDPTVTSGEKITITVSSSEKLNNFDLVLVSYDGLSYSGCSNSSDSAVINSSTGSISYASAGNGTTTLGTYTFIAPQVSSTSKYKVVFKINDVSSNTSSVTVNPKNVSNTNNNTDNSSNNSNSGTPTPPETQTKSSVATLSNLGIKGEYDFSGFKASTYLYSTTVPNEVESIEIYANKGQSAQTISGTGIKKLAEGENKVDVQVTAEDGKTTKTYTINITRKVKGEQTVQDPEEKPQEDIFGLTELKIEGIELQPQFKTDVNEYKIELTEDIAKLDITTIATEANAKIEITGNEDLKEGENIITIVVKSENEEKTAAYQLTINKTLKTTGIVENQDNKKENIKIAIIIAVLAGVIVLIILIIIKIRKSKKSDENYIPYGTLLNNYDDKEIKNEQPENSTEETENYIQENEEKYDFEEDIKKKKHTKGKRFK